MRITRTGRLEPNDVFGAAGGLEPNDVFGTARRLESNDAFGTARRLESSDVFGAAGRSIVWLLAQWGTVLLLTAKVIRQSYTANPPHQEAAIPRKRCFTFIELILVILILVIVSTLATVRLRHTFEDLQLQQFGSSISHLSEYLRTSAIAQNNPYCLTVKTTEPIEIVSSYVDDFGVAHSVTGKFSKSLQAPVSVKLSSIEPAGRTAILFYPDGSADQASFTLSNNNKTAIILTVNTTNGSVHIK
jgi:Tfp pilus assembly protein FimT